MQNLQSLDLEAVLAHVPTPLVVLRVGTGAPLYANRAARRLAFAYREIEGWSAVGADGQHVTGAQLPHHAASRGECFDDRIVHFVSETGRYSLRFHCHGLGGDACILSFEEVTTSEPSRTDLLQAEVEELASSRCPTVVVENVLDVNRIRAGAFMLDFTHGRLADALRDAHELLGPLAATVTFEIEDAGDGDWDRARMARTVANLVLEAIEHGGGAITVHLAHTGGDVELRVVCPRVSIPSRQSLALFIAKEIVAAHRGTLAVSRGLFRVRLPVTQ